MYRRDPPSGAMREGGHVNNGTMTIWIVEPILRSVGSWKRASVITGFGPIDCSNRDVSISKDDTNGSSCAE